MKVATLSLLLIGITALSSCYTKKGCAKFCIPQDTVITIQIDTTVTTDSTETAFQIDCSELQSKYDSLSKLRNTGVIIHDTVETPTGNKIVPQNGVLIHSDSIADVYYSVTSKGKLSFKVKTKPQKLPIKFEKKQPVKYRCPEKSLWQTFKSDKTAWIIILVVFILGMVFAIVIRR